MPDRKPSALGKAEPARLSDVVSVPATGRGNPTVNLSDGHELITSYLGPEESRVALEQNQAQPLSLATADFDEDGVPDLVSGYGYYGRGIVTLLRGNVDSIYPNAPEAKQRRANGTFTDAPFLSPAQVFDAPIAADFIGAGDFNGDGHWDIVCAARFGHSLNWFAGDGRGNFAAAKQILLPGFVTALTVGEINRRDGLNDVVVGVTNPVSSQVLVFEGPNGALASPPESLAMPGEVSAIGLGQLDSHYAIDLAVAAGNELVLFTGRDRKLSLDPSQQADVFPAVRRHRVFDSQINSLALGDFSGDGKTDIALLLDGQLQILNQPAKTTTTLEDWLTVSSSVDKDPATRLFAAASLSNGHDCLIIADALDQQLHILADPIISSVKRSAPDLLTTLDVVGSPVAVLRSRVNSDAISDLILLTNKQSSPVVLPSAPQATFVVTNTNATGSGSLQFAILDANETPGADLITFNIPGTGLHRILPTTSLPTITDPVTIDATTQPDYSGDPVIVLDGNQAGIGARGLTIGAGPSTIKGFRIEGWKANGGLSPPGGDAISITGGNGNLIVSNVLGVSTAFNNQGVHVSGGNNHIIGGTVSAARNVIGWTTYGVILAGGTTGCLVQGNFIGTDVTGTQFGGGANTAVFVGSAWGSPPGTANTIGGTTAGARNIIAGGFTVDYVSIAGQANLMQGNYVGTDVSGNTKLVSGFGSSAVRGVSVSALSNTVGGTTPASRNVIVAGTQGVRVAFGTLMATDLGDIFIQGNYIGTRADGTGNLGQSEQGVYINTFGPVVRVGGTSSGAGNVISNGGMSGVEIANDCLQPCGNPTDGKHSVQGNLIGTDASGTLDLGNTQNGVYIRNSNKNVIGGVVTGARNVISGNGLSGVLLEAAGATGNVVQGNYIGTNASGTAALGNDLNGITTSEAPGNTIGGSVVEARNIISGNARHGVSIGIDTSSGSTGITVQNNYIGTDVTGNACLGNQRDGVFVNRGSVNHTIIDNLITCNARNGVNIPNFATNDPGIRIEVTNNSIYANGALGIDLGDAGITANDAGDVDGGANFQQNFPVLTSFALTAPGEGSVPRKPDAPEATVTVNATLNSTPNTVYTVHWYFSNDSQCTTNQAATRPLALGKIPGVTTDSNGNASFNFPFDFPVGTNSGVINTTATDPQGNTSEFSGCLPVSTTAPPTVKLSASTYPANENVGSTSVNITRTGDASGAATVNYATSDSAGASDCNVLNSGKASSRCDYETTIGILKFAPGETSKTILIPVIDDVYAEGNESFTVTLTNAAGANLGSPSVATVTITDNESTTGTNPLNQPDFFVRMQYVDFFTREPDAGGLAFWTNQITECGSDQSCVEIRRINVSAAFFLSIEFQETGYLVERIYRVAYGSATGNSTFPNAHQLSVPIIRFNEFLPDTQQIGRGVVVGQAGWEQVLENNKQTYLNEFVQRSRFTTAYPGTLTPAQFVDALNVNAGNALSTTERNQLVSDLTNGTKTRAQVLRAVAEDSDLNAAESNRAFVLMQFYGYLRRNPNDAPDSDYTGYDFWLGKLNQFNGNFVNAEMVKAFIVSGEYKARFGP